MIKTNLLLPMFESIFFTLVSTAGLNELDLIKLKLPTKEELKGIVEGNSKIYKDRMEDRVPCKVCMFYESPDDGDFLVSRPFKCTHFFHPKCITAWKFFGLDKKKRKENKFASNECFVCKTGICDIYKDLYDHDLNSNGTVTKYNVNARNVTDDVSHSVARIQLRAPTTTLNFRDQQEASLNYYQEKFLEYRDNQLLFQEYMLQDNIQSSPQPTNSRLRSTRHRNSPKRLMNRQSKEVNNRVKVKPHSLATCINNSSISVLTMDTYV